MTRWDAVVFDLGGVLIEWDPRHLYRRLLPDHEVELFLTTVCTPAWNAEQDAGRSFREGIDALVARFPEHAELVRAYWERPALGASRSRTGRPRRSRSRGSDSRGSRVSRASLSRAKKP
jgi:FMN phosphatase YigB (HAD superfamily)